MEVMTEEGAVLLVFSALLGYLQLLYQGGGGGGGGGVEREACFNSHAISVYASIALISATAAMPLPGIIFLKISIFLVILAYASILSCYVPAKLIWLPYLSCIRLLFNLLPNPSQDRFLQFCSQTLTNNADQYVSPAIERLVSLVASILPLSSSSQEPRGVSTVEDAIP